MRGTQLAACLLGAAALAIAPGCTPGLRNAVQLLEKPAFFDPPSLALWSRSGHSPDHPASLGFASLRADFVGLHVSSV